MNIQDWFPLGWTGWISLQSKGLSRVFSNTTVEKHQFFSAQFLQSCPTLCDPKDCSMPCFLVHHQLLELTQTHVLRVSDALQPYHPLLSSSPAFNLSQHQGLFPMSQFFVSGGQSIGVSAPVSVFPMNIQDWFPLGWTGWISLQSKELSRVFSNWPVADSFWYLAKLIQLFKV